jgi:hypothetical protein
LYNTGDMAVKIEMQNTGDPRVRGEIVAIIEHVLSDRPGEWRVSIVGSRANDNWEMKVEGAEGFERSYSLVGGAGAPARSDWESARYAAAGEQAMICNSGLRPLQAHTDIATQ